MMVIKGNGGEGKTQIGTTLESIFGTNMKDGSIGKISENRFARADLEHILLCVDDSVKVSTGPAQRKKGAPKRPCKHLFFARPESIFNQI